MLEQPAIRRGGGMVEFVDDDDIEVVRREMFQPRSVQALNGGKDVLETAWPLAANPQLTEGVIAERLAKGGLRLREDLFAMGDE